MQQFRAAVKNVISGTLYWTGIVWLLAATQLRGRALVLMYHRVLSKERQSESYSAGAMFVTPQTFDAHLQFLKRRFNPVTLPRFIELLESGKPFPRGTCLITFDDGWLDNLAEALPALERHGVPAVVFVPSGRVGSTTGFWQERLTRLLTMTWADERTHDLLASLLGKETATSLQRQNLAVRIAAREAVNLLKERPPEQIEHLIRALEDQASASAAQKESSRVDALMSWDEVRRMRDSGLVAIGAHGESHTPFTKLQRPAALRELKDSAARLRLELTAPIDALAYPNGDHDQTTCSLAQASGYRVAFTTRNGSVAAGADPYRLCRISIHESAAPNVRRLACRMLGLF